MTARRQCRLSLATLLLAGCAAPARPSASTPPVTSAPPVASAPPVTSITSTPPVASTPSQPITWIRDDADAAFARARAEHKLVFVDLWATWCHTCLSMQKFVLTDAKLPGAGAHFVFLAIDGDRAQNAEFLRRFPPAAWPTFYLLSPDGPRVRGRWIGAASPAQLARFFADAERAPSSAPAADELTTLVASADVLATSGSYAQAAEKYTAALAQAPSDWPRAPDVRVALASALVRAGDPGACVDLALAAPAAPAAPLAPISASDQAASALECAEKLAPADARRRRAEERAEATLAGLCETGAAELTPDDRADACGNLMDARKSLGDAAGARRAAETRLAVLEAAVRGLPDDVALIYDPALSETLVSLDRGDEALALLQARARALPSNYNPPYHLARIAAKLGRTELGLAAVERALALAYGPRRANAYAIKADLLLGAHRQAEAVAVLETELAYLTSLPEGQKRPETERVARERLAKLKPTH